jgi:Rieske Fe-S protein
MSVSPTPGRRIFFKIAGASILAGFGFLWTRIVGYETDLEMEPSFRRIKSPIPTGITFYEDFYLIREGEIIKAFSTICTHAGCQLKKEVAGHISCPCHGSQFDAVSGKAIKGPAFNPLKSLPCRFDPKSGELIILI